MQAFKTTNATKTAVIDALAYSKSIRILNDPVQVGERRTKWNGQPSGMLRYSARRMHDDTVIALALAGRAYRSNPTSSTRQCADIYCNQTGQGASTRTHQWCDIEIYCVACKRWGNRSAWLTWCAARWWDYAKTAASRNRRGYGDTRGTLNRLRSVGGVGGAGYRCVAGVTHSELALYDGRRGAEEVGWRRCGRCADIANRHLPYLRNVDSGQTCCRK